MAFLLPQPPRTTRVTGIVHYNQLYELLGRDNLYRLSSSSLSAEASRCPPWSIDLETAGFYWVEYQANYPGSEEKEGLKHPDPRTLAPYCLIA